MTFFKFASKKEARHNTMLNRERRTKEINITKSSPFELIGRELILVSVGYAESGRYHPSLSK